MCNLDSWPSFFFNFQCDCCCPLFHCSLKFHCQGDNLTFANLFNAIERKTVKKRASRPAGERLHMSASISCECIFVCTQVHVVYFAQFSSYV